MSSPALPNRPFPRWASACLIVVFFSACVCHCRAAEPTRLRIFASLFPQYDFARIVAGDKAEVVMVLPPGAESHSFEPSPSDMMRIAGADIFIHTGEHMEPWAARLAATADRVLVVDASTGITPMASANERDKAPQPQPDHDHEHDPADSQGEGHYHAFDPHIWLDPHHAGTMVDTILAALLRVDPDNGDHYRENAARYKEELHALDAAFRARIDALPRRSLVFGDRFAFAYFFSRYGLEEVGPYNSCAPGAEPGLRAVIETVQYIKDTKVRFIYREITSQGRIATVLAEETGVEVLTVDSLHNPRLDRLQSGYTYLEGMRTNMDAFARGLQ